MSELLALSSLLDSPEQARRFLRYVWPARPLHVEGDRGRWSELFELDVLTDVPTLLAQVHPGNVRVQLGDDEVTILPHTVDGHKRLTDVQRLHALALYGAGGQLYLEKLTGLPRLQAFLCALADDLGMPRPRVNCNLFAVRGGSSFTPPLHWDNGEGFVVQLCGVKRWTLADNHAVPFPSFNYDAGRPPRLDQALLFESEPQPDHTREIELTEGSVLFLPRGVWHTTTPVSDSIHLDIMLHPPTWAGVLTDIVHRLGNEDARLRAPIAATAQSPAELVAAFARVRGELIEALSGLDGADLALEGIGGMADDLVRFRRIPEADMEVAPENDGATRVRVTRNGAETVSLTVRDRDTVAVLEWIGAAGESFGLGALRAAFTTCSDDLFVRTLRFLWSAEVVEVFAQEPSS
ncbi:JmjC domain-containing protein [Haliangium sp.]|uniref:JmjC domain-containing protein n=1 Tax=Haliangium sp. TaxID=2663208 RepID=UPI003D130F92